MIHDVAIVGAGQAGLAVAYFLKKKNIDTVLLEAGSAVGDGWRKRYDSLTLFTPSQYSNLPGFPIPGGSDRYLRKNEIAAYLEAYSRLFQLNIKCDTKIEHVEKRDNIFRLRAGGTTIEARSVVIATSALQEPFIPGFAAQLDPRIRQTHSARYRNPTELTAGSVLIVGAGNSGAQIAEELYRDRPVFLSFETLPKAMPQRFLGKDLFWWYKMLGQLHVKVEAEGVRSESFKGPAENAKRITRSFPLIGSTVPELLKQGKLARLPRAVGSRDGKVLFADQSDLSPANIIWATGFAHDFGWIDLPAFDRVGYPIHTRGESIVPGLHFIGLPNLHSRTSTTIGFVGLDAEYLVERIAHTLSA